MPGKLGRTTEQRLAILRNQASQLLWYGKLETTAARAKELQPYVEAYKDGPKKLAARRVIMAKTYDLQEIKEFGESKKDYKGRKGKVQHPLMEKIFNELAPKYAQRKEEVGQGGGYTRIYLLGQRRGDAAESAIIELV